MRFISVFLILSLITSCENTRVKENASDLAFPQNLLKNRDILNVIPEYGMLVTFSRNIDPALKLDLRSYGINNSVPQGMRPMGKTHDFSVSYYCYRDKEDEVSIAEARRLVVSIAEGLRVAINADERFKDRLYIRPFLTSFLKIHMNFVDSSKEELAKGVTSLFLYRGKIHYDGEKVGQYNIAYHGSPDKIKEVAPMQIFKNRELLEETYEAALEKVTDTDGLIPL